MTYNVKVNRVDQDGHVIRMDAQVEKSAEPPLAAIDDSKEMKKAWSKRKIDIAVVVHDDPSSASRCLEALASRTPDWADWTLTVIDNASDEFTSNMLKRTKWIDRMIRLKSYGGYLPAMHVAQKETSGEWVVFVDQRAIVGDGWLEGILRAASSDKRVGMVVPWTTRDVPPPLGSNYLDVSGRLRMVDLAGTRQALPSRPLFAVRRTALDDCGGWDVEHYGPGYGEVPDLWMRMVNRKWLPVRASSTYVLDGTQENGEAGLEGHRRFMARWGKNVAKECGRRVGKEGAKETASAMLSVPPSRPKVVFCFREMGLCGATLAVTHICNALIELGWDASIAYTRMVPGHSLRHMPMRFTPWSLASEQGIVRGLRAHLKDAHVIATIWTTVEDVVKVCNGRKDLKASYFVQDDERAFRLPNGKLWSPKDKVEKSYAAIKNKVVNSDWVLAELRKIGHDGHKIGIGVDPLMFRPMERPADRARVMAHCRPSTPRRGWPFIAKALSRAARSADFEFVAYDEEFDPNELAMMWKGNLGRISPDEVARHMGTSHVFFEGSDIQGFGMQSLEAMACGCALVSTDNRGIHNYGTDGHDCIIVPHGDINEAAAAVCQLIGDDKMRETIGANARRTAERFNWKLVGAEWSRWLRGR